MKKILMLLAAAAIAGCANTVAPTNASHGLVKLTGEPINCQFLYRLENEVSVYGVDDAEQHLRNKIADQVRGGN
ncbi:MAG: hypothetical protein FWF34_02665, partial [Alphaproteobacteria bacterium]|nr:hypothetical protein [Alphaproteobacteria bacterium]